MSVSPDYRQQKLKRFRLVARMACIALVILGVAYLFISMSISQGRTTSIGTPELQKLFSQRTAVLHALTGLQIAGCALLLLSLSRRSSPFSPWMLRCLVISGVLSVVKALANALAIMWLATLFYAFAGPYGPQQLQELALETFDVPSVLLGIVFLVAAAAFSYGRELFIDSEEIA